MWLELEDQMPNEPSIVHRNVTWEAVYHQEYCQDMRWWGTSKELSRSWWTTLRDKGLVQLSI
eukprot:3463519-Pleurochrysis_carterae.AAC.1